MIRSSEYTFFALFCFVLIFFASACKTSRNEQIYLPGELDSKNFKGLPGEIAFAFAGDIMMWDRMKAHIAKRGVNYPFEATAALLQSADYAVGNLECPIAVKSKKDPRKGFYYKVPPFTLEGLKWAGFDMMSLANNHIRDCGADGLMETFEFLDKASLSYFGAGKNPADAMKPKAVEVKGLKTAFVGFVSDEIYLYDIKQFKKPGKFEKLKNKLFTDLAATDDMPGTVIANEKTVREMVARAKERADFVIVVPHWGVRYHQPVWENQEKLGHVAIDAGADLVIGHHNHIRQAVEIYKGKPIVYGIGNFAFGSGNRKAVGGFLVRAIVKDKKLRRVLLYPTYTMNRSEQVDYQVKILKDKSARKALKKIRKRSAKRGANFRIENDVGVVDF